MARRTNAARKLSATTLPLPDGGSVTVDGGAVAIRDAEGRLLIRFENGAAEIAAPAGDLTLAAPAGRVVVRAAEGLEVRAGEEGTEAQLRVDRERATVVAPRVEVRAAELVQTVERLEVSATRLVERTRDTFREAAGLLQTRAGRARTLVEDAFGLWSRRTTLASREETSIDGSKVLLG